MSLENAFTVESSGSSGMPVWAWGVIGVVAVVVIAVSVVAVRSRKGS